MKGKGAALPGKSGRISALATLPLKSLKVLHWAVLRTVVGVDRCEAGVNWGAPHQESHQSRHEVMDDEDRQGQRGEGNHMECCEPSSSCLVLCPALDGTSSCEPLPLQVQVPTLDPGQLCVRTPAGASL